MFALVYWLRVGTLGWLQPEFGHGDLKILPRFLLLARIAQQVGRMIGHDKLGAAHEVDASTQSREWALAAEQPGGRSRAERSENTRKPFVCG